MLGDNFKERTHVRDSGSNYRPTGRRYISCPSMLLREIVFLMDIPTREVRALPPRPPMGDTGR